MPAIRKLPSGHWQATCRLPDGSRDKPYTAPLKGEVVEWARKREEKIRTGRWRDDDRQDMTVTEWHTKWRAARVVEPETDKIDGICHKRIAAEFGSMSMRDVDRMSVQAWVKRLATVGDTRLVRGKEFTGPVGPAAIRRAYRLLKTMLNAAVDDKVIDGNPCRRVQLPTSPPVQAKFFTPDEVTASLEKLGEPDRTMVQVMIWCGLRIGEATALRACDVIWLRRRISVEGTADARGRRKNYAKNSASFGEVPAPQHVIDALSVVAAGKHDEDRLFTTQGGHPIVLHNWRERVWYPALEAAGVRRYNPHTCRHTCASWLVQDGVPIYDVARLLRHRSVKTTETYYAHLAPDFGAAVEASWRRMSEPVKLVTHI